MDKQTLLDAVWPDATVEEGNLTVSISHLRRTLGDASLVETVAGCDYGLTAAVEVVPITMNSAISPLSELDSDPPGGALP